MARFLVPSTIALMTAGALGASVPDGTWPTSLGNVSYSEVYVIAAGETFDGGMKTYDRSDITCEGQTESGTSTAVFSLEAGATLKNAIIGTNQMEGVHCDDSDCTIENVWWEDVCEDALSIKGGSADSVSTVTGGGARYADDKVVQHNGYGSVVIDGFYVQEFGKLYRSCGTCGDRQRFVNVSNVYAVDPDVSIVTVNENYGDEAILKNIYISASDDDYVICGWSEGTDGDEPTSLGDGISYPLCQYSDSDIHINEAVPSSSSSGSSTTSTATVTTTSSSTGSADVGATETATNASDDSDVIAYTTTPSSAVSSTESSASATEEESSASSEEASTTSAATSSAGSEAATSTEASSAEEATSSYTEDASTSSYTEDASTSSYTEDASTSSYTEDASTSSYAEDASSTSSYSEETTSSTSTEETTSSSSAAEATSSAADETEAPSSSSRATEDDAETASSTAAEADDTTTSAPSTASSASAETTTTTSKCNVRRHRD